MMSMGRSIVRIAAGGHSLGEEKDRPYGERSGLSEDPLRATMVHRAGQTLAGDAGAGFFLSFWLRTLTGRTCIRVRRGLHYCQILSSEDSAAVESSSRDRRTAEWDGHASCGIGNAVIELGDTESERGAALRRVSNSLTVADPDACSAQAWLAGGDATLGSPIQWYGDRVRQPGRDQTGFIMARMSGSHDYCRLSFFCVGTSVPPCRGEP